jgi:hypothetical protein
MLGEPDAAIADSVPPGRTAKSLRIPAVSVKLSLVPTVVEAVPLKDTWQSASVEIVTNFVFSLNAAELVAAM